MPLFPLPAATVVENRVHHKITDFDGYPFSSNPSDSAQEAVTNNSQPPHVVGCEFSDHALPPSESHRSKQLAEKKLARFEINLSG